MTIGHVSLINNTDEAFLQIVRACGDVGVSERHLFIVPMHDLTREEFDQTMNRLISSGKVSKRRDRFFA
jgi:hypothetical protein